MAAASRQLTMSMNAAATATAGQQAASPAPAATERRPLSAAAAPARVIAAGAAAGVLAPGGTPPPGAAGAGAPAAGRGAGTGGGGGAAYTGWGAAHADAEALPSALEAVPPGPYRDLLGLAVAARRARHRAAHAPHMELVASSVVPTEVAVVGAIRQYLALQRTVEAQLIAIADAVHDERLLTADARRAAQSIVLAVPAALAELGEIAARLGSALSGVGFGAHPGALVVGANTAQPQRVQVTGVVPLPPHAVADPRGGGPRPLFQHGHGHAHGGHGHAHAHGGHGHGQGAPPTPAGASSATAGAAGGGGGANAPSAAAPVPAGPAAGAAASGVPAPPPVAAVAWPAAAALSAAGAGDELDSILEDAALAIARPEGPK